MKIRFGLVGCGRISKNHIAAIAKLKSKAELVAVCDIDTQKAQEAAEFYRGLVRSKKAVPVFKSFKQMLSLVQQDVISICTPSGIHYKQGIMAAQHGINVLSEKPIATSLKHADSLIEACDISKVKLFVVKQNRLNPTMQALKKAVEQNRFGRIYMVVVNVFWTRPQSYYDQADWRGTWKLDGGAFLNQASHYVDALVWLMGEFSFVSAFTKTLARDIEAEDSGNAIVDFKNGALGSVNVTMLTYPKNLEGSITVIGEKGTVRIAGIALNRVEKWEFDRKLSSDKDISNLGYEPSNVYGNGHLKYYSNVIDILSGKSKQYTDGRDARRSLEMIDAIYRSSKKRKIISLD